MVHVSLLGKALLAALAAILVLIAVLAVTLPASPRTEAERTTTTVIVYVNDTDTPVTPTGTSPAPSRPAETTPRTSPERPREAAYTIITNIPTMITVEGDTVVVTPDYEGSTRHVVTLGSTPKIIVNGTYTYRGNTILVRLPIVRISVVGDGNYSIEPRRDYYIPNSAVRVRALDAYTRINGTRSLNITLTRNVTILVSRVYPSLTVLVVGNGTVRVNGTAVPNGAEVAGALFALSYEAAPGWRLRNVYINGTEVEPPDTLVLVGNTTIRAVFVRPPRLEVLVRGMGNVTVNGSDLSGGVLQGRCFGLGYKPQAGWRLAQVRLNGTEVEPPNELCIGGDTTLEVTFMRVVGIVVHVSSNVNFTATVEGGTVKIVPGRGNSTVRLMLNSTAVLVPLETPRYLPLNGTITIESNVTLRLAFARKIYITVASPDLVSVEPAKPFYLPGDVVAVRPAEGYVALVNGTPLLADSVVVNRTDILVEAARVGTAPLFIFPTARVGVTVTGLEEVRVDAPSDGPHNVTHIGTIRIGVEVRSLLFVDMGAEILTYGPSTSFELDGWSLNFSYIYVVPYVTGKARLEAAPYSDTYIMLAVVGRGTGVVSVESDMQADFYISNEGIGGVPYVSVYGAAKALFNVTGSRIDDISVVDVSPLDATVNYFDVPYMPFYLEAYLPNTITVLVQHTSTFRTTVTVN